VPEAPVKYWTQSSGALTKCFNLEMIDPRIGLGFTPPQSPYDIEIIV